ncbi:MAG: hypothetical protein C0601_01320 [Candidatus Muiribacterium halophilum]|uniref:Uncharacterized protein n=1 Tax=Muiribacterium halophilum TaxID=2053465 RepID=A0A2N5ZLP2_MUIH1|nr:MAG: hypothetical protein C0601_01320 [Candidatus Muirbacterium halophilum]
MKKYRVVIPYKENKSSNENFKVDFEIIASSKEMAVEKALKKFYGFLEYNLASWVRTPIKKNIQVEFLEDVEDVDPWSYL